MTSKVTTAIRPSLAGRQSPLHVGVVVAPSAPRTAACFADLIELLARTEGLHLQNIYRWSDDPAREPAGLFRLYERLAGSRRPVPTLSVSTQRLTQALPTMTEAAVDLVSKDALDVLIWLGESPATGDCTRLARCGVLSLCFGEPHRARREPPYFWEAYRGEAVKTLAVQLHRTTFDTAVTLEHIVAGTHHTFPFTKNADDCFAAAGPVLIRALKRLADADPAAGGSAYPVVPVGPPPGNLETVAALARHALNSVSSRLRSRGKWLAWQIYIRSGPDRFVDRGAFRFDGFRAIEAPSGHYYADPFVVDRDERSFLFFEDFDSGTDRGRLAVMEVSGDRASAPYVIADQPYHLSYPCVFSWKGDDFMIPESAADGTVQLLRCRRFPDDWQLEHVLCDGVRLLDTTPFRLDDVWYFFVYTEEKPQELHLFSATALDGRWVPHPANPICSDVRRARSGGALFHRNGSLIRPAQDGSVRYGYGLMLNEVHRLSPTEYEESPGEFIDPAACGGLLGVHTINRSARHEVIDGLQLMPR
jgi:hypothetical protein